MPENLKRERGETEGGKSGASDRKVAEAGTRAAQTLGGKEKFAWMILPTVTWLVFVGVATVLFRPFMSLDPALCLGFLVGSGVFAFALMASGSVGTTFELNITCVGLLVLALILYSVGGRAREIREKRADQAARISAAKGDKKIERRPRHVLVPGVLSPASGPAINVGHDGAAISGADAFPSRR